MFGFDWFLCFIIIQVCWVVYLVGFCRSYLYTSTCPKNFSFLIIYWTFYQAEKEILESFVYKL